MGDLKVQFQTGVLEAGCDEAGRGCLAGPVCAAAVILPESFSHPMLNDSKKVTEKQRNLLREIILKEALCYGIAMADQNEIDEINILRASILAMHRALDQLSPRPQYISVDGNKFMDYQEIPHSTIVKGDGKYMNIAAASILAKTSRDEYMRKMSLEYPTYGWERNKGYPTKDHRTAIERNGITPIHRKSFRLTSEQLYLNF